jgi:CelD/BcsL family acetyltransferase involved in cellulose biosynthesis
MRIYLLLAAQRGWLRIFILYINNEPAAFEWGIEYGSTFFLRTLGFDPKWRDWSVGTVLFLKALDALCEEANVKQMDFGFGDAEYKKIYSNSRNDTRSLFVYADRFYPRLLCVVHQVVTGVWMAATFVANKLGLERKIKRVWRDQLRRKARRADSEGTQRDTLD